MDVSITDIATKIKTPNFPAIVQAGFKGTMRNIQYIKAHRGGAHPYALLFGPLGGLLIPEEDLQPVEKEVEGKAKLLPSTPNDGPPLPSGLGIKWPWKK